MSAGSQQNLLVRHGATEWSGAGRHTGRTDIPLTGEGQEQARLLGARLRGRAFAAVLCSPLQRARQTCALAGFGNVAEIVDDLAEWDYGDYDGLTTAEIRSRRPGWSLWRDGCPHGEDAAAVGARADRVVARLRATAADVAVFAHGHLLRVLAARWTGLPPGDGRLLALVPAALCVLGREHDNAVVWRWNDDTHLGPHAALPAAMP